MAFLALIGEETERRREPDGETSPAALEGRGADTEGTSAIGR